MRRRSGQVLIAGATLILAVMLVSAAMMPTLNTDIEPSSEVYNIVGQIVYKHAADIVTSLSAYQCAKAVIYSDEREQKVRNTEPILQKDLDEIVKKLKSEIGNRIKGINDLEITINRAWIDAYSVGWNGNPKNPTAGVVTATMNIKLTVSFTKVTQKYKYTYEEELKIETRQSKAKQSNIFQGLGVIQTLFGFVPIVGAFIENIEGVKFDLAVYVADYKVIGTGTNSYKKNLTGTNSYKKNLGPKEQNDLKKMTSNIYLDMLKPRKFERYSLGGNKPGSAIWWEEYMKVDWTGIVISLLLDLVPVKPLTKGVEFLQRFLPKKQLSYSDTDNSVEEVKIDFNDFKSFLNNFYNDKKVMPIKPTQESGFQQNFKQGRNQNGQQFPSGEVIKDVARIGEKKIGEKVVTILTNEQRKIAKNVQSQLAKRWASSLASSLDALLKEGRSAVEGTAGRYHLLAENVNTKTGKTIAYFDDNDPLLWIVLPLHDGKALFASCVWLNDAWYGGK